MKNKKADIPVMILVICVFAVCALAILSFSVSFFEKKQIFNEAGLIEELNSQIEQYNFYKNLNYNYGQIKDLELLEINEDSLGNKFILISSEKISGLSKFFVKTDEFSVKYFLD